MLYQEQQNLSQVGIGDWNASHYWINEEAPEDDKKSNLYEQPSEEFNGQYEREQKAQFDDQMIIYKLIRTPNLITKYFMRKKLKIKRLSIKQQNFRSKG